MASTEPRVSPLHGTEIPVPQQSDPAPGPGIQLPYRANFALIDAVKACKPSMVNAQIAMGIDVNVVDADGMTALHHAAGLGARPCIRLLVASKKCDYLIRDRWGRYAFDLAIEWARDYAVARLLVKHQMRQARERGVTAIVLK